jgi:hypothetical protein
MGYFFSKKTKYQTCFSDVPKCIFPESSKDKGNVKITSEGLAAWLHSNQL